MTRVIISEHKAKTLLYSYFGYKYEGLRILDKESLNEQIKTLQGNKRYVIKVDEGIKKRQKKGLLFKDVQLKELKPYADSLFSKNFNQLLIEEYVPHSKGDEKFIALERKREGISAYFSKKGGLDIESAKDEVGCEILNAQSSGKIRKVLNVSEDFLNKLKLTFDNFYFSFLESNPFIVKNGKIIFLDLAVEVDSAAEFLSKGLWSRSDFIDSNSHMSGEELLAKELAEKSSASFKLNVLNPKGSIFTIFSGGGASIVLADEIGNIGKAQLLANYAEYSGNPNAEETYIFTKIILTLAIKSPSKNKVIYIAGGVANFTDIRETFKGVIRALEEKGEELRKQNIKVYVRRGGPHYEEGLKIMKACLEKEKILGGVHGPETILTDIIN